MTHGFSRFPSQDHTFQPSTKNVQTNLGIGASEWGPVETRGLQGRTRIIFPRLFLQVSISFFRLLHPELMVRPLKNKMYTYIYIYIHIYIYLSLSLSLSLSLCLCTHTYILDLKPHAISGRCKLLFAYSLGEVQALFPKTDVIQMCIPKKNLLACSKP